MPEAAYARRRTAARIRAEAAALPEIAGLPALPGFGPPSPRVADSTLVDLLKSLPVAAAPHSVAAASHPVANATPAEAENADESGPEPESGPESDPESDPADAAKPAPESAPISARNSAGEAAVAAESARLNERQRRFCDHYLLSGDALDAARRAGYCGGSARQAAWRLLRRAAIRSRLAALRADPESRPRLERDVVLGKLESCYRGAVRMFDYPVAIRAAEAQARIAGLAAPARGGARNGGGTGKGGAG